MILSDLLKWAVAVNRMNKKISGMLYRKYCFINSFADHFYFDIMNCAIELKKNVIVSNANESVVHLLNAVAKTQNKKPYTFLNIPIYKYSSQS